MRWSTVICLVIVLIMCSGSLYAQCQNDWEYHLVPYLWGTGIEGDVAVGDLETSIDASFADIAANLDFGFMVYFEAEKQDWGYFTDITYADVSANGTVDTESASLDTTMLIAELGGSYVLSRASCGSDVDTHKTDLVFGGRYWNLDSNISVTNTGSASLTEDWIDPFVGVRYTTPIADRWGFRGQFDIGGFGIGSDFTWNLNLVFSYRSSSRGAFLIGYRILNVDRESGSGSDFFKFDTTMGGPMIGYDFVF